MHYLYLTSLLAALNLSLSVVAAPQSCRSTSSSAKEKKIASGWYPGWLGKQLPPKDIPWEKYNALTFAFAVTTPNSSIISLDTESAELLPTFVSEAHAHGVKASVSIGGWGGSQYYSTAVASENRTAFVKAVVDLVNKYDLDGIDFDWEYPGRQGIGCNTISPDDSANFLAFLQELRKDDVGAVITLSAAVGLTPFNGVDGSPMKDVSAFATVLNHIAIMNYDVWGSFSDLVGPNSPLDDACAPTQAQVGSATSAIQAWTAAKFPIKQISLGTAMYGHSFHVDRNAAYDSSKNLVAYPPFDKNQPPLGDSDIPGAAQTKDQCGNAIGIGGTFNFNSMIADGYLRKDGTVAPGLDYRFDNCSKTSYVYNSTSQVMISYDDPRSFASKGEFIKEKGLAGYAVWQIAGDSHNNLLISAIRRAMSKSN